MKRELFPTGKKRKEDVAQKMKEAGYFTGSELGKEFMNTRYGWLDSPLDNPESSLTDKPLYETFKSLLPPGEKSLRNYIESTLEDKRGDAVGIEFGGIGVKAFSQFSQGFFRQSIGVTLADHRESNDPDTTTQSETHKIIEGNFFDRETYQTLNKILEGGRASLILERIGGGVDFVPQEPYLAAHTLQQWYELLDEGGLMLIEIPRKLNVLMPWWYEEVKKHKDTIDFDIATAGSVFRLRKLTNAPETLPLIKPELMRKILRRYK